MDLEKATKGMLDARAKLRSSEGVNNPVFMSKQMSRLANYTGALEEHLGDLEKQYEDVRSATYMTELGKGVSATAAENVSRAQTAELNGDIKKLTRLTGSSWKIVGTVQSRYNHIEKEIAGQT